MSGKKKVLFLFDESPSGHIRFFEGMRMALGFSVTHPGLEILLLGDAVRSARELKPLEIGLPREMLEFFPLFVDLGVRTFLDADRLEKEGLLEDIPSYLLPLDARQIREKIRQADVVIPFSGPAREG
ncbi:MAG: DsrE family protein [Leptospirillum sp.]